MCVCVCEVCVCAAVAASAIGEGGALFELQRTEAESALAGLLPQTALAKGNLCVVLLWRLRVCA